MAEGGILTGAGDTATTATSTAGAENQGSTEATAQGTTTQGTTAQGQGTTPPWYGEGLDETSLAMVKDYATPADAIKAMAELKGKVPQVPTDVTAYGLDKSGLPATSAKLVGDAFLKAGLTPQQAQAVLQLNNDAYKAQVQADVTSGVAKLNEEWGQNFQGNVDTANRAVARFATPEFKNMLNVTGLGSNPVMVKMFYEIGKAMAEDTLVTAKDKGADKTYAEVLYPNSNK